MVTLQNTAFWISPPGGLYEGESHLDLIDEIIGSGELDADPMLSTDDFDRFASKLISEGWIRGVVAGTFGDYGERGPSVGFEGTLAGLQKQEGLIEEIIRDNRVDRVFVDIRGAKMESVVLESSEVDVGFIKAVQRNRSLARMAAQRRPNVRGQPQRAHHGLKFAWHRPHTESRRPVCVRSYRRQQK